MKTFFLRSLYQDTQNDVKRPEKRFRKNARMELWYVCVCVRGCVYVRARTEEKIYLNQIKFL